MVRHASPDDAPRIAEIYNYYIAETVVTFEEQPVSHEEMARRIAEIGSQLLWIVAEREGVVAGYAYATPWKGRSAYRYSAESTIYLAPEFAGKGIGSELYGALLADLRARGMHAVMGGISLPNGASVALHEKMGFRKVAEFSEVGWKFGRWVNVGYWQVLLERNGLS